MVYLYKVEGIENYVSVFLFGDMLETRKVEFLRKNLEPSIVKIEDGQIRHVRDLNKNEYRGEFQDKTTGRHYMTIKVGNEIKKVIFENFYAMSYEEVLKLHEKGKKISNDVLHATFIRESEKVAAIVPLYVRYEGNNYKNALCIPTENQYKKKDWHFKMEFSPMDSKMTYLLSPMQTYTSDIFSMINSGTIKLVNKEEYSQKLHDEAIEKLEQNKKKFHFSFHKNKNIEEIHIPVMDDMGKISSVEGNLMTILEDEVLYFV